MDSSVFTSLSFVIIVILVVAITGCMCSVGAISEALPPSSPHLYLPKLLFQHTTDSWTVLVSCKA